MPFVSIPQPSRRVPNTFRSRSLPPPRHAGRLRLMRSVSAGGASSQYVFLSPVNDMCRVRHFTV